MPPRLVGMVNGAQQASGADGALARLHRLHGLVTLANDVVAQALGTVLAAGLIYVGAAALGMLGQVSAVSIGAVVLLSGGPIALGVGIVHGLSARHRRRAGSAGMDAAAMALAMMGEKAAMGVPLTPGEQAMLPVIASGMAGTPAGGTGSAGHTDPVGAPGAATRSPQEPRHG